MNNFITIEPKYNLPGELYSEETKYLKVPIAVLGNWVHPEYGDVSFKQKDFDDILKNWSDKATGYEPPLFTGHPTDYDSLEGAPSVAFLKDLYQDNNTLFGVFDPVNDKVFNTVKEGAYRYSSGEFYRNAKSKTTGEAIGTVLRGAALTNRPFLTGLPRVQAVHQTFSESEEGKSVSFLFDFNKPAMTEPIIMDTPIETPVAFSDKVAQQIADLALKVEDLTQKLQLTETQLKEAQSIIEAQATASLLEKVQSLNISSDTKRVFSDLLPSLSKEQREAQFLRLSELSSENHQKFSEVQGSSEPVSNSPTEEIPNPYLDIIKENQRVFAEMNKGKRF